MMSNQHTLPFLQPITSLPSQSAHTWNWNNDFQLKLSLHILLSFKSGEFLLFSLVFSFFLFLRFRVFQFFSCLSSCVTHATAFLSYENRDSLPSFLVCAWTTNACWQHIRFDWRQNRDVPLYYIYVIFRVLKHVHRMLMYQPLQKS